MISKYPGLYRMLWLAALTLMLMASIFPRLLHQMELPLAIGLILLLGLPHGATDHLLFRQLLLKKGKQQSLSNFYILYLGLVGVFGLMWWLAPWLALGVFLLISMYHFGQSNWNYLHARAWLMHFSWGAFVLLVPIIWHFQESRPVIESMVRQEVPLIPAPWRTGIIAGLAVLNQGLIVWKAFDKSLTITTSVKESLNLWILFALFLSTPLMLGFAVYFAGWHSLSSSMDQIVFFRKNRKGYNWQNYAREALPFTLIALGGLAAFYLLLQQQPGAWQLGPVFMFIASVTLPHMVLIDQLYEQYAA